jgi:hypothetical protein
MRALTALTVFMGILIVAGVVTVAVTIMHRLSPATQTTGAPAVAGHARLKLPPGSRIEAMTGVGERLVLRIADGKGAESLITIEPLTGAILETIDLGSEQP